MELFSFGSKPDKPEESFGVFLRLPTEANDKAGARGVQLI
jgi:hypothetical protein